jgi:predicted enzyme related to lactoylglutathione lyase
MASSNPVSWFEIPVSDLARATKFYESAFGVTLERKDMGPSKMAFFPMHHGGPGCGGSLLQEEGSEPSMSGTVVYIEVPRIADTLTRIEAAGGKTLVPQMKVGEFGSVAHFKDSEGNRVALHSEE